MPTIKLGDRCADCKYCKVWQTDHTKASCSLYSSEKAFHPDRQAPVKCVEHVPRKY